MQYGHIHIYYKRACFCNKDTSKLLKPYMFIPFVLNPAMDLEAVSGKKNTATAVIRCGKGMTFWQKLPWLVGFIGFRC